MQGVKFVVRVQSGFRVGYACSENADVTIWLSIGADVILERPTCEWEGKINALAPRTGYLIGRLGAFDGYRLIHGRTEHEQIGIVSEAVRKRGTSNRARNARFYWWARQDSNLQPDRYERPALTIELQAPPRSGRKGAAGNGAGIVYRHDSDTAMPGSG